MSKKIIIFENIDPRIIQIIRPVIINRAEDKGLVRTSDYNDNKGIDDVCVERYLTKFDYLDIMEICMDFEEKYIAQTGKKFRIEEQDFDVLNQHRSLKEFCYVLRRCTEGNPVPYEPSKAEKLKTKFIQYKQSIKNSFTQILYNQKAQ